MWPEFLGDK